MLLFRRQEGNVRLVAKGVLWVECSKLSFLSGWGLAAKGGLLPPGLVVHLQRVWESRVLLSKVLSFVPRLAWLMEEPPVGESCAEAVSLCPWGLLRVCSGKCLGCSRGHVSRSPGSLLSMELDPFRLFLRACSSHTVSTLLSRFREVSTQRSWHKGPGPHCVSLVLKCCAGTA